MKSKNFLVIPIMANGIFLEGNEGNMEEIGVYTQNWENFWKRARLGAIWRIFSRKKIILEILEISGTPEKQKGTIITIIK